MITAKKRGTSSRQVAMAMVRSCGISPQREEDLAADIVAAMHIGPRRFRHALAVREIKRHLGKVLFIAESKLPGDLVGLKALGLYESVRSRYDMWQEYEPAAIGQFDYHSKRFAIENGICPRCTKPGEFSKDGGKCECGFEYV